MFATSYCLFIEMIDQFSEILPTATVTFLESFMIPVEQIMFIGPKENIFYIRNIISYSKI